MDSNKALELLKSGPDGIAEWNGRRLSAPDEELPSLFRAILDGADLRGANLSSADLRGANLRGSNLRRANLSGANLRVADLSVADLRVADLRVADLLGANLLGSNLRVANLSGANLFAAILIKADLRGSNLPWANLSGANLSSADLSGANLRGSDLRGSDLRGADLRSADLRSANLSGADFSGANLSGANFSEANLSGADFSGANLSGANLSGADFSGANLSGANLSEATMVRAGLRGAKLRDCRVFGISVWDIRTDKDTEQVNLIISDHNDPVMTVDNLKVAQFIYLLLNNEEIRGVIDTITSKVVLILGRFTPERKTILDAMRDVLRKHDRLPVMFDFEKPASRGYTETVTTLAWMARFVFADLTDATEVRAELPKIVPAFPLVPIQPLILASQTEYVTFEEDIRRNRPWVLETFRYQDLDHAIASLPEMVLAAEAKVAEVRGVNSQGR
jgi:uncharacterized protein YjbI with pentapeptide repeats